MNNKVMNNKVLEKIRNLENLEEKKKSYLKNLDIISLKKVCCKQEKLIDEVLKLFKEEKLEKINKDYFSSFLKTFQVNKEIIQNFKNISDMYFKPFRVSNYQKDGENRQLDFKSVSIST